MNSESNLPDKALDELERNIGKMAEPTVYGTRRSGNNGGELKDLKTSAILETCKRAADMVRDLHRTHEAEGETMARHLEQIGESFLEMCREAANQVRAMRVMPQEMAQQVSDELLHVGEIEAKRHAHVTRGLVAARDALLAIERREDLYVEQEKPENKPNELPQS